MGAIAAVIGISLLFILMVVVLSLMTINKGYGYKHTIDPPPNDEEKIKQLKDKES